MTRFDFESYTDQVDYATYDPDDNKIRIYSGRVDQGLYDELKRLGFGRAYKQGCFFQVWTPAREDAALALCGDIEEEGTSVRDRAEAKAERFADYSTNAGKRSQQAHAAAKQISDHIPFGQPILVGHHSEKRARRDQEKIESRTRKAIDEWRKQERWQQRAQDVIAHAGRRERPDVIMRRIKKLEAERRKCERDKTVTDVEWARTRLVEKLFGFSMFDDYELTPEQESEVDTRIEQGTARNIVYQDRWISHLDLRLAYERELYANADGPKPDALADKLRVGCMIKARSWGWQGPVIRVNKGRDGQVSSVSVPSGYSWNNTIKLDKILEVRDGEDNKTAG